jgi:Zn-dependent protease
MNGASIASTIYQASTWVLPVVFAVTFHEAAHGFIALRFGDDTALRARRVTFNPLNHIDLFGTIILPALLVLGSGGRLLFGYAKPVPVNFNRLRDPRRDMVWVALAGPGTNVLLAIASSLLFYGVVFLPGGGDPRVHNLLFILVEGIASVPRSPATWIAANLANAIIINAALCVFNMLPLPPLDGGRVAVGLLPRSLAYPLARLERYGIPILLALLFVLPWIGGQIGVNLNILAYVIGVPMQALINFVLTLTGQGG